MIGTLAGAFGRATVAEKFAEYLKEFPEIAPYAGSVAITVAVLLIGYFSLILGELVPKNLALRNPERSLAFGHRQGQRKAPTATWSHQNERTAATLILAPRPSAFLAGHPIGHTSRSP